MEWLEPWYSVADDPGQVAAMQRELQRELAQHHPLYGLPVRTIGRRQDCDDVLYLIDDGTKRYAVVHLTWPHSPPDSPPWPNTAVFDSFEEWVANGMYPDHDEFCGSPPS